MIKIGFIASSNTDMRVMHAHRAHVFMMAGYILPGAKLSCGFSAQP